MAGVEQLSHNANQHPVPRGLGNIKMERTIAWEIGPLLIQVRIHGFKDVLYFSDLEGPDVPRGHGGGFTLNGNARAHNFKRSLTGCVVGESALRFAYKDAGARPYFH